MSIGFGIFDHIEASEDRPAEEIYEHRIASEGAEAGGFSVFTWPNTTVIGCRSHRQLLCSWRRSPVRQRT
jgi:hypothetical protein